MQEVLLRRYGEAAEPLPDLIVIDGGKGQLSSALEVIRGVGLEMNVISLAKQFEMGLSRGGQGAFDFAGTLRIVVPTAAFAR